MTPGARAYAVALLATISACSASPIRDGDLSIPKPQTVKLDSRPVPRHVRNMRSRALDPVTVPFDDFFLGTDLQWFGNISVGTPPQDVTVVFDTGSSTLEFVSTLCGEICNNQTKFNPNASSSFVDTGRVSTINFGTGVGVDPVINNNYRMTLRSGIDTVSVGGIASPNVSLFLVTDQTPAFAIDSFSGIQGMSAVAQGFFASLIERGLPALFGMLLTPQSVGGAEMTIGGFDSSKFFGDPVFASIGASTHWTLPSTSVFINGVSTPVLATNRNIIFDSGTSNILFNTETTNAIYAMISPDIQPFGPEPGAYGIACNKISDLAATIDVTFTAESGAPFNLTIPSRELNVGPFASDPSICQTLINAVDGFNILGGSVMKHYYTIHDIGGKRMGFAPNGDVGVMWVAHRSPHG